MPETRYPGFVNAHTHSHCVPWKGTIASAPQEVLLASHSFLLGLVGQMTPDEQAACALVLGMENLRAGNVALLDHLYCTLTPEHVYAVADAYEALGIRAWVFPNVSDLPMMFVTKEYYPKFASAISMDEIPPETRDLMKVRPYKEQIDQAREIIKGWEGNWVQMGLAVSNTVSSSDDLLTAAAELVKELDCPLEVHA